MTRQALLEIPEETLQHIARQEEPGVPAAQVGKDETLDPLNNASSNDPRPPAAGSWRYKVRDVLLFKRPYFNSAPGSLGGLENDQKERTGKVHARTRERTRGANRGAFLYTVDFDDPPTKVARLFAHADSNEAGVDDDPLVTLVAEALS